MHSCASGLCLIASKPASHGFGAFVCMATPTPSWRAGQHSTLHVCSAQLMLAVRPPAWHVCGALQRAAAPGKVWVPTCCLVLFSHLNVGLHAWLGASCAACAQAMQAYRPCTMQQGRHGMCLRLCCVLCLRLHCSAWSTLRRACPQGKHHTAASSHRRVYCGHGREPVVYCAQVAPALTSFGTAWHTTLGVFLCYASWVVNITAEVPRAAGSGVGDSWSGAGAPQAYSPFSTTWKRFKCQPAGSWNSAIGRAGVVWPVVPRPAAVSHWAHCSRRAVPYACRGTAPIGEHRCPGYMLCACCMPRVQTAKGPSATAMAMTWCHPQWRAAQQTPL